MHFGREVRSMHPVVSEVYDFIQGIADSDINHRTYIKSVFLYNLNKTFKFMMGGMYQKGPSYMMGYYIKLKKTTTLKWCKNKFCSISIKVAAKLGLLF